MRTATQPLLGLALLAVFAQGAGAAGGHHAVDDAAILDPGRCHIETWHERHRHGGGSLLHLAPACRIGMAEWTLGMERDRVEGARDTRIIPQVKIAGDSPVPGVSIGAALGATRLDDGRTPEDVYAYIPVSWQPGPEFVVHVNAGYDRVRGGDRTSRFGVGADYRLTESVELILERYRQLGERFTRAGTRWNLAARISLDLSYAWAEGSLPDRATLGLTWEFGR